MKVQNPGPGDQTQASGECKSASNAVLGDHAADGRRQRVRHGVRAGDVRVRVDEDDERDPARQEQARETL